MTTIYRRCTQVLNKFNVCRSKFWVKSPTITTKVSQKVQNTFAEETCHWTVTFTHPYLARHACAKLTTPDEHRWTFTQNCHLQYVATLSVFIQQLKCHSPSATDYTFQHYRHQVSILIYCYILMPANWNTQNHILDTHSKCHTDSSTAFNNAEN